MLVPRPITNQEDQTLESQPTHISGSENPSPPREMGASSLGSSLLYLSPPPPVLSSACRQIAFSLEQTPAWHSIEQLQGLLCPSPPLHYEVVFLPWDLCTDCIPFRNPCSPQSWSPMSLSQGGHPSSGPASLASLYLLWVDLTCRCVLISLVEGKHE